MIYNSAILKNEYKEELSNSTGLNILRFIQMALAFIVIAWLNLGVFTYVVPYIPNYIRWGLFLAWFCLALTSNKKFAKIFCIQCWPLLLFYFYMLFISFVIEKDLVVYIKSISFLIMVYSIFLYYFDGTYRRFQKFLCAFFFRLCSCSDKYISSVANESNTCKILVNRDRNERETVGHGDFLWCRKLWIFLFTSINYSLIRFLVFELP